LQELEQNREARTNLYLPESENEEENNHFSNTTIPRLEEGEFEANPAISMSVHSSNSLGENQSRS